MAAAILIGIWLHSELTFNQNFKNYDRIARVMQNQEFNGVTETWYSQAMQIGPELRDNYGSNFKHVVVSSWPGSHKLGYNDKSVRFTGTFTEPGITHMLDLKMLKGTRDGLKDPHSILLSASVAKAVFGDEDPLDKSLRVDDKHDVKVTGVYEDLPANCDFTNLQLIMPFELDVTENLPKWVGWGNSWFQCFAQLEDGVDFQTASVNIHDAKMNRVKALGFGDDRFKPVIFLHPMNDWRLYSQFENGVAVGGSVRDVWMFGTIGFFVLILACINFMNLSTARAERRAKEVGIRKTVGSLQRQLVKQFYVESFIVVGLAMIISILLAQAAMPWFSSVSKKNLGIPWSEPMFWLMTIGFALIVGIISGSYPAFYLSSFKPVKALKGAMKASRSSSLPRKVMVVVQFSISVVLITATFVIVQQIDYAQNRPLGYSTNGIIFSPIRNEDIKKHFEAFSNDLHSTGAIKEVALTDTEITDTGITNSGFTWSGKPDDMQDEFWTVRATQDFGKLAGWELVDGRDFLPSDTASFIINETAAKYMNLKSPVGEVVRWGDDGDYRIIGVVKDMITMSPYSPVKQMIFTKPKKDAVGFLSVVNIKLNPEISAVDALAKIETVFKKYDTENPFEYSFADEKYASKFNTERIVAKLCSGLAGLAIFICCLGLFGLASYMAEQRTKEIGIRKVLGASIGNLWRMMSKDFVVLVVIAGLIALPPAYYFSSDWLSQFEYRVPLSWLIFAAAIGGSLIIALLTVSYHALRSALSNPVRSLRTE
jgi:ABC-type antimicrobial peptide transport system permease subunit